MSVAVHALVDALSTRSNFYVFGFELSIQLAVGAGQLVELG